ncbi:DUF2500 domain-containing protein [Oscillibacter sp.]|uniref:DUF2500 domain-containing protein n=1 Tax=Oscillibacter sp. TaxID=1945593 RepID=UPI0028AAB209|nr:DUF2500 domain-containing protein [Oscillibacter sp.]
MALLLAGKNGILKPILFKGGVIVFSYGIGGLSGLMFSVVPLFIGATFIVMLVILITRAAKGAQQWKKNNASPVLTVDASVVAKRSDVSHHHHTGANNAPYTSSSTTYYVTFQVASGDRMEFTLQGTEYGMLTEQDTGKLTFQGTRYLGFERGDG